MKTALVTGASRGIGLAIARELGVNGYQVAVMATRGESFYPESTRTLRDAGISYAWYAGDIGKSEDRIRIVREAAEHFGEIHVLVNNAGVAPKVRADLLDMTEESFDYVIGTNTKGNMFMTQAVARQMMKQPVYGGKRGTIPEGIFVYEIRPGVIRTDMTSQVEEKYTELIKQGMFPIARWGVPEDVAKAVRAFCSDDFCYTTGNYIDVDGGFHIRRL